jgi:hypothetical protein
MSTLHLNTKLEPTHVVLEDWYEELADESLDPANILEKEEDERDLEDLDVAVEQSLSSITEATTMTTNTLNTNTSFNLDAWLSTAKTLHEGDAPSTSVVPTPQWLTLKSGLCTAENAFVVTAGVVKATRQVMDALFYTQRQLSEKIEALHMQEQRNTRQTISVRDMTFGPKIAALGVQLTGAQIANTDVAGFNPDGVEFEEANIALAEEIEKLEAVVENGKRILQEIMQWIHDHAEQLQLQVQIGHTTRLGIIGNEIRSPKYVPLDHNSLLLAIEQQREFIKTARR